VTAPVTLTPAAARPAAVLTAAPTGSSDAGSGTSSTDGLAAARDDAAGPRGDAARAREPAFGLAAPAAFAPGFALVRAAFGERARFAAGLPSASAFAAALAAESRFALRLPGRELGRFPSTPPSSAMDSDSSSARSGYTEAVVLVDKVVEVSTG
jgi:hypothetical protein